MKIAISAEGNTIGSLIDQRFGRCKYFLIVESENNEIKEVKPIENEGAIQGHGAGIKAAQQIGELGVDAVITGSIGPNSADVLSQLGINVFHASGISGDAVKQFLKGDLEKIKEIAEPHSGMDVVGKTENERIFFPLLNDKGMDSEISGHFGHAPVFGIYDVKKKELKIIENNLEHTDPSKSPVDQIIEAVNPTTVFALGIGARAIQLFDEKGIAVKTGSYTTIKEAIDNLDKLKPQAQDCGQVNQ